LLWPVHGTGQSGNYGRTYATVYLFQPVTILTQRRQERQENLPSFAIFAPLRELRSGSTEFVNILALQVVVGEELAVQHEAEDAVGTGRVFL
jgi:hypothetical protein